MGGLVWYVSYGANMDPVRLGCYIAGGTPPGGSRANPGCRDGSPPRETRPVWLPGAVYFALESPMWGGGLSEAHGWAVPRTAAYLASLRGCGWGEDAIAGLLDGG